MCSGAELTFVSGWICAPRGWSLCPGKGVIGNLWSQQWKQFLVKVRIKTPLKDWCTSAQVLKYVLAKGGLFSERSSHDLSSTLSTMSSAGSAPSAQTIWMPFVVFVPNYELNELVSPSIALNQALPALVTSHVRTALRCSLEPGPTLVDMVTTGFGPGGQ